jgi:hypothetical protein
MKKFLAVSIALATSAVLAACANGPEEVSTVTTYPAKLDVAAELDSAVKTGYSCVINNEQGQLVESFGTGLEESTGVRMTFRVLGDGSSAVAFDDDIYVFAQRADGSYPDARLHAKVTTDARKLLGIPRSPSSCLTKAGSVGDPLSQTNTDTPVFKFVFKDGDAVKGWLYRAPNPTVIIGSLDGRQVEVIVNVATDRQAFWGVLSHTDIKTQAREAPSVEVETLAKFLVSRAR